MRLLGLLLSLLSLVAVPARAQTDSPEVVARAFYAWVLAHPSTALPSPAERTELAGMIAPELARLLDRATATEARCVKAAPKDEKPNIIEGALFVGNYEGATEIAYGEPRRTGETVTIDSTLVYVDPRFAKAHPHRAHAWSDRLTLRLIGGRWQVHDIGFAGNRSLTAGLAEYIAEGMRSCRAAAR